MFTLHTNPDPYVSSFVKYGFVYNNKYLNRNFFIICIKDVS